MGLPVKAEGRKVETLKAVGGDLVCRGLSNGGRIYALRLVRHGFSDGGSSLTYSVERRTGEDASGVEAARLHSPAATRLRGIH
jgi:hypothetical protein